MGNGQWTMDNGQWTKILSNTNLSLQSRNKFADNLFEKNGGHGFDGKRPIKTDFFDNDPRKSIFSVLSVSYY